MNDTGELAKRLAAINEATRRAHEAIAAINEATRRTHEAIVDACTERKALTDLLAQVRTANSARADEIIVMHVNRIIGPLMKSLNEAVERKGDACVAKFDHFIRLLLREVDGTTPIEDILKNGRSLRTFRRNLGGGG